MACKEAVLPEPLLTNHTINCLTFEENTRLLFNDNLYLFPALAPPLHGNQKLEEETSKIFVAFINRMDGIKFIQFQGDHMNDLPVVEDINTSNIFSNDIDIVNEKIIGELERRSMMKFEKTVRLLRYNNHICYVNNINAIFKSFRCPSCATFFNRATILEHHRTTCSDRVKNLYPKNVYQVRKTLFHKEDSFGITYTNEPKFLKK